MALFESYECPRCGAPLPKFGKQTTVVCTYCRANISAEQRVAHPGAMQALSALPRWVRGELLLGLVAGLAIVVWQLRSSWQHEDVAPLLIARGQPGLTTQESGETLAPEVAPKFGRVLGKLLLTVNEQPAPQTVVLVSESSEMTTQRSLVAINSSNGQTRWRWPLPPAATEPSTERAWVRDSLVVRTREEVYRLDGETGSVVWSGLALEPTGRLCFTDAYVGIRDGEEPRRALDWATGRVLEVKGAPCELPYSSADPGPNFSYLSESALLDVTRRAAAFQPLRGLLPHQGNARVVLGVSSAGAAPTPAVAVVANGRWIWKQDVSAYTFAALPEPAIATVRKESVVVPYWDTQNQALRLSALGLKKGHRLWDISLIENAPRTTETDLDIGVTLDGTVLVRLPDGRLNAYSLQSGKLLWSVGEP